jgi:hypothetical protein
MSVEQPLDDGRLRILRNVDFLKCPSYERKTYEFEVLVDAHIVGDYDSAPYHLGLWEFSAPAGRLYLRVENAEVPASVGPGSLTWNANQVLPIAQEFAVLASLFLRRRLRLGAQVREGDRPMWRNHSTRQGPVDPALSADKANLGALSEWFSQLSRLDSKVQPRFMLAVRMYHQALLNTESYPDIAYLNLVSAVEALSTHHDIGQLSLAEIDAGLANLIGRIADTSLRADVEKEVRAQTWFVKRKFVAFVCDNVESSFWGEATCPEYGRVKPAELPALLGRLYGQRSRTLHRGEPFPWYALEAPTQGCDVEFASAFMSGSQRWERKDYIPNLHFFERLVNHVLKVYLKRNQTHAA